MAREHAPYLIERLGGNIGAVREIMEWGVEWGTDLVHELHTHGARVPIVSIDSVVACTNRREAACTVRMPSGDTTEVRIPVSVLRTQYADHPEVIRLERGGDF